MVCQRVEFTNAVMRRRLLLPLNGYFGFGALAPRRLRHQRPVLAVGAGWPPAPRAQIWRMLFSWPIAGVCSRPAALISQSISPVPCAQSRTAASSVRSSRCHVTFV
jgi:hypothetical protein